MNKENKSNCENSLLKKRSTVFIKEKSNQVCKRDPLHTLPKNIVINQNQKVINVREKLRSSSNSNSKNTKSTITKNKQKSQPLKAFKKDSNNNNGQDKKPLQSNLKKPDTKSITHKTLQYLHEGYNFSLSKRKDILSPCINFENNSSKSSYLNQEDLDTTSVESLTEKNSVLCQFETDKLNQSGIDCTCISLPKTEDEFVDAQMFFQNFLDEERRHACQKRKPITKAEYREKYRQVLPLVRRPRLYKLLEKEDQTIPRERGNQNCTNYLHEKNYDEYMVDNFNYILEHEDHSVLRVDVLFAKIDFDERDLVVNWLVYAQQVFEMSESDLYKIVRLFDKVITAGQYEVQQYRVVAAVCMWLINKLCSTKYIPISKIHVLLNGQYSLCYLKQLEIELLLISDFDIDNFEPYTIIYYYMKVLDLSDSKIVYYGAQFLIEIFMVSMHFSSIQPSLLAAAVLVIVLQQQNYYCKAACLKETISQHLLNYDMFEKVVQDLQERIKFILSRNPLCSEILLKYSSQYYMEIAKRINFL